MKYIPVTSVSTALVGKCAKNGGTSKEQASLPFIRLLSKMSRETQRAAEARGAEEPPATPVASLLTTMKQLGLPLKDGKLPAESIPNVRALLMEHGLGPEQVEGILKRSTSDGGDILVDTLVAALAGIRDPRASEAGSLLVRRDQRVSLEGLLASLGLPPETISRLIEQARTSQGDIEVGRLAEGVRGFSNQFADVDLVELLRGNGIAVTERDALTGKEKRQAPASLQEVKGSSAPPQTEHQERLELASRLRQEGLLPEQVKSILERLQHHRRNIDPLASPDGITTDSEKKVSTALKFAAELGEASAGGSSDIKGSHDGASIKDGKTSAPTRSSPPGTTGDRQSTEAPPTSGKISATERGAAETNPSLVSKSQPHLAGDQAELATPAISGRPRPFNLPGQGQKTASGQEQGELGRALGHTQNPQPDLDEGKTTKPTVPTGQAAVQAERGGQPVRGGELLREAMGVVRVPGPAQSVAGFIAPATGTAVPTRSVDLEPFLQIAQRLVHMTTNGEYVTRLHLHPPELGRVKIEIRLEESRLKVALVTESAAVKELMEAQMPQLRQHLGQDNLHLEQFQVTVRPDLSPFQRSHREPAQEGRGNKQPGTTPVSAERVDEGQETAVHPGLWGTNHQIDLFA